MITDITLEHRHNVNAVYTAMAWIAIRRDSVH